MPIYKFVRNWWWVVLRGLFAVVFIPASFFGTYFALRVLVLLFGAYALIDGLVVASAGLAYQRGSRSARLLVSEGLLGIGAGGLALLSPSLAVIGLIYLIVGWACVRGTLEVTAAIRMLRAVEQRRLVQLSAALILVLGAMLVFWPGPVGLGLIWLSAAYVLLFGLLQIALGLRIRNRQLRWMRPLRLRPVAVQMGPVPGWRTGQALAPLAAPTSRHKARSERDGGEQLG